MSRVVAHALPVEASDGHRHLLPARIPEHPRRTLLWLPALGVAAKHYLPFADALAQRGVAVFVHEWRGSGSVRADAAHDWGYRELLTLDVPASETAVAAATPDLPHIVVDERTRRGRRLAVPMKVAAVLLPAPVSTAFPGCCTAPGNRVLLGYTGGGTDAMTQGR